MMVYGVSCLPRSFIKVSNSTTLIWAISEMPFHLFLNEYWCTTFDVISTQVKADFQSVLRSLSALMFESHKHQRQIDV